MSNNNDQEIQDLEQAFKQFFNDHGIVRVLASKPKTCPNGKTPVRILINGKIHWVCR